MISLLPTTHAPSRTSSPRPASPRSRPYADGVGPWKRYIIAAKQIDADGDGKPDDLNGDGKIDERDRVLLPPSSLVKDAHDVGLFVHTWTFRNEPRRLASDFKDDPVLEYKNVLRLGGRWCV